MRPNAIAERCRWR